MPEQTTPPTKDELSKWLMDLRTLYGGPRSPIQLNHNFYWAIVGKMIKLRGCICAKPYVTTDEGGSAHFVHESKCGLPASPADGGPAPTEDGNAAKESSL